MVKYLDLINRFWQLDEQYGFSSEETRLYFYLLKVANSLTPAWPESFDRADRKVAGDNKIKSVNSLKKYRDRLIEVGLIDFQPGGKGQGNCVRYHIRYQNLTPKRSVSRQKMTPNRIPKLDPNAGLVSSKVLNFDTNTIYKRLKTGYVHTNEGVRKKMVSFLAAKKRIRKAPLVPRVPPKPVRSKNDPFTLKSDSEKLNVPYSTWKAIYLIDGNEAYVRKLWLELTDLERETAFEHTPGYMLSNQLGYLKGPANYLEQKEFNNRIINRHGKPTPNTQTGNPYGQGAIIPSGCAYRQQSIGRRNKPGDGDAQSA